MPDILARVERELPADSSSRTHVPIQDPRRTVADGGGGARRGVVG